MNNLVFLHITFYLIFGGVQLLYNAMLLSAVQQSYTHIHSFLRFLPIQVTMEQSRVPCTVQQVFISYLFQSCASQSPNLSHPLWQTCLLSTSISTVFLLCKQFICIIFLASTYKQYYTVFLFPFMTYFTLYNNFQVHPCCCKWHYFIPFHGQAISHCIYVPHLLHPFICRWIFRLLPCPGYCKQCSNEHWGACILSNYGFLQIFGQEWDCWIIWQLYFQFLNKPPYCFPQ